jgi:uncharacterized protein YndB with AHSA1/START domain
MTEDRPIADGIVENGPNGSTQVHFSRRLRHPIHRVWAALTDPDELRKWWGEVELELTEGGAFRLRWRNTDDDGNVATLDGAITKIDPPWFLEISADWGSTGSDEPGARTTLTWELEPDGDQTLLRFTNTVDAPAQDVSTAAGWHMHLDALATVLAGGEVDLAHPETIFEPIHQAYAEKYSSSTD